MPTRTTMPPRSLHDAQQSAAEAIERVSQHDPDWNAQALAAVALTARCLPEFITDDIWYLNRLPTTTENRAMGAVLPRAQARGWIEPTTRFGISRLNNACPRRIWRSRILDTPCHAWLLAARLDLGLLALAEPVFTLADLRPLAPPPPYGLPFEVAAHGFFKLHSAGLIEPADPPLPETYPTRWVCCASTRALLERYVQNTTALRYTNAKP